MKIIRSQIDEIDHTQLLHKINETKISYLKISTNMTNLLQECQNRLK